MKKFGPKLSQCWQMLSFPAKCCSLKRRSSLWKISSRREKMDRSSMTDTSSLWQKNICNLSRNVSSTYQSETFPICHDEKYFLPGPQSPEEAQFWVDKLCEGARLTDGKDGKADLKTWITFSCVGQAIKWLTIRAFRAIKGRRIKENWYFLGIFPKPNVIFGQ